MKTKMLYLMAAGFLALLSAGCEMEAVDAEKNPAQKPADGTDKGSQQTSKYTKEYWGEWLSGADGAVWYISANDITIGGGKTSKNVTLNKQSEKVIEVTENGAAYKLYASRVTNAAFTGKLAKASGETGRAAGETGFSAAANVPVKVTNVRNPALFQTVLTNSKGEFTMTGIISGDSYIIEPAGGRAETVTIDNDKQDIGTITMTNGVNFKTRVLPWTDKYGEHLFGGGSYTITVEVENTGTEDCTAATYQLKTSNDSNIHITGHQNPDGLGQGIFKTIEPGKKKKLILTISCDTLSAMESLEYIDIYITDTQKQKTWKDSVSFMIKKGEVDVKIRAEDEINGVFIRPNARAQYFKGKNLTLTSATSENDFLMYFCGATAATETRYSFGIERPAPSYSGFNELMKYEPNNTETAATPVTAEMGEAVISYLHKNDIDFYKFKSITSHQSSSAGNEGSGEEPSLPTARWASLAADGAYSTATTAKLVFDFSVDMGSAFNAASITLDPELTTGTLTNKGGGRYELPVNGSWENNTTVVVTLTDPAGWTITGGDQKTVTVYRATTHWNSLTADGADSTATTKLTFDFSVDMGSAFNAAHITLDPPLTTGMLSNKGGGKYELPISGSWEHKTTVAVTLADPTGWTITGDNPKTVMVYRGTTSWNSVTADGTDSKVNTTKLMFDFSVDMGSAFSTAHITLDPPLYKGTLTNKGGGKYELPISGAWENKKNIIVILSAPAGWTITGGNQKTVMVYKYQTGLYKDDTFIAAYGLNDALNYIMPNAKENDAYTIVLSKDESLPPLSPSCQGKHVSITLTGGTALRKVSLSQNGSLFTIGNGITFTLDNNIELAGRSSNTKSLITVNSGGTLVLNDGATISGNTAYSSSNSSSNSSASPYGGGVYVAGGTFTMNGGTISENTASVSGSKSSSYGGGVYVGSGTFTMSGGTISENTASASAPSSSYGGGVYVSSGTFTMRGGTISGNRASANAGYASSASSDSSSYGGGVYVSNGIFMMSGGTISENTASASYSFSYGGGVYVSNGIFMMSDGSISGNMVSSSYAMSTTYSYPSGSYSCGGGVYVSSGTFTMSGGVISGNTARSYYFSSYGGGVYVSSGTFTMRGGTISENTASSYGGGVYVSSGTFTMSGGTISGNTASSSYGGGVYVDSKGTFTKTNEGGVIYGNEASLPAASRHTAIYGSAVYMPDGNYRNPTLYAYNEFSSKTGPWAWE